MRNFLLNSIGGCYLLSEKFRNFYYNCLGLKIGSNSIISAHNTFSGRKLLVGSNSFINHENYFDLTDSITIGDNVWIGMRCTFITSTHEIGNSTQRAGISKSSPIVIEDGCWIGANVTILPGVTIKSGAVIAAGAVVNKCCEKNCLYAGVPAKKIKILD
jgi:acetyltransferase-like isoleucine patch superfamily enzyme